MERSSELGANCSNNFLSSYNYLSDLSFCSFNNLFCKRKCGIMIMSTSPSSHLLIDIDLACVNGSRFWKIWAFDLVLESATIELSMNCSMGMDQVKKKTKKLDISDCQRWWWWWPWWRSGWLAWLLKRSRGADTWGVNSSQSPLNCSVNKPYYTTIRLSLINIKQMNCWLYCYETPLSDMIMTSWMFPIKDGDTIPHHCYCHR